MVGLSSSSLKEEERSLTKADKNIDGKLLAKMWFFKTWGKYKISRTVGQCLWICPLCVITAKGRECPRYKQAHIKQNGKEELNSKSADQRRKVVTCFVRIGEYVIKLAIKVLLAILRKVVFIEWGA